MHATVFVIKTNETQHKLKYRGSSVVTMYLIRAGVQ